MQSNESDWLRPKLLHFLVSPSRTPGRIVAHCLDYDLVVSATSQEEALRRLKFIVRSHVETARRTRTVHAVLHSSPDSLWDKFRGQLKDNLEMESLEIGNATDVEDQHNYQVGIVAALVESADQYAVQ